MSGLSGLFRFGASSSWQRAVSRAEKLVGYPTSFMSLRHLLSDEVAQVAVQLRRLVGTDHPLLKTARGLLGDQKRGTQTRGLVVLLLAKAASPPGTAGLLPQHRSLAEIIETISTAALIHRGIVDVPSAPNEAAEEAGAADQAGDMVFGNRLATLSGDFLLASASTGLAELNNTRVVAWVSAAIADVVEAEFAPLAVAADGLEAERLPCTTANLVTASRGLSGADWERYVDLSLGSLLSACARAAILLADQPDHVQVAAGEFGRQWARLHSLVEELGLLGRQLENGQPGGVFLTAEENYGLWPRPCLAHVLFAAGGRPAHEFGADGCPALARCWSRVDELAADAKAALRGSDFPNAEGVAALVRLVDTLVQR